MADKSIYLRVFLSYSSGQRDLAEQIYLALIQSGHEVFFDRKNLPPSKAFDQAIRDEIESSDLMVFLISPESVQDGKYTRTELLFARETWPNPDGRVLPVMVVPTDFSEIPNYLKSVTVFTPEGNIPAEVAAKVNDLAKKLRLQVSIPPGGIKPGLFINDLTQMMRPDNAEIVKRYLPIRRWSPGLMTLGIPVCMLAGLFGESYSELRGFFLAAFVSIGIPCALLFYGLLNSQPTRTAERSLRKARRIAKERRISQTS